MALFNASILPLMAMDPEQSSSQITWRGLPAYSPPGRTAMSSILPLVWPEIKPRLSAPAKEKAKGMALVTDTHTKKKTLWTEGTFNLAAPSLGRRGFTFLRSRSRRDALGQAKLKHSLGTDLYWRRV